MRILLLSFVIGIASARDIFKRQACADKLPNCKNYGQAVCTDPTYAGWVTQNCPLFCGKCSGSGSSGGIVGVGGGQPSGGGGFHGTSTGCVYGGSKIYQQGETWKDGCKYSCTCTDASTGHYSCTELCLTWNNLPPSCSMIPPAAGMCCQTPHCPPNVQLQYPPGYTPQ